MSKKQLQFVASDAWLLLAIILASGNDAADLSEIVAAGDGINHAIFTEDEMESGLYRLRSGGYIEESNGRFKPSSPTAERYRLVCEKARAVLKQMDLVSDFIGATPWEFGKAFPRPENRFRYPGFTSEKFRDAVRTYQRNASKILKELRTKSPTSQRKRR
jgi:hypothetical protein